MHLSSLRDDEENDEKNTSEYDRLCKVKPQHVRINERMVASKTRMSMKQNMMDKSTTWGCKLFILADSATGYTWNFSIDMGKSKNPSYGLSNSSVVDLLPFSLLGVGYTLYMDSFYTSPLL